jgi:hypothetical protein
MGCILYMAPVTFSGTHSHEVNGKTLEHNQTSTHRLILTPAHLTPGYRSENPGFPDLGIEMGVSDCIEVR